MTPAPEVILHIGTHKTGTTSIQMYWARHEQARGSHDGPTYPLVPEMCGELAHHALAGLGGSADVAAVNAIRDAVAASAGRVVLSSELLSLADPVAVRQRLGHDAQVVLYLRRQDDYVESLYRELVKAAHIRLSPEEFVDAVLSGQPIQILDWGRRRSSRVVPTDYLGLVRRWQRVFDRVTVRDYESTASSVGVVGDFASLCGLTSDDEGAETVTNRRYPARLLQYRRAIDPTLDDEARAALTPYLWKLHSALRLNDRENFVSPELRKTIRSTYAQSNKELSQLSAVPGLLESGGEDLPRVGRLGDSDLAQMNGTMLSVLMRELKQ